MFACMRWFAVGRMVCPIVLRSHCQVPDISNQWTLGSRVCTERGVCIAYWAKEILGYGNWEMDSSTGTEVRSRLCHVTLQLPSTSPPVTPRMHAAFQHKCQLGTSWFLLVRSKFKWDVLLEAPVHRCDKMRKLRLCHHVEVEVETIVNSNETFFQVKLSCTESTMCISVLQGCCSAPK